MKHILICFFLTAGFYFKVSSQNNLLFNEIVYVHPMQIQNEKDSLNGYITRFDAYLFNADSTYHFTSIISKSKYPTNAKEKVALYTSLKDHLSEEQNMQGYYLLNGNTLSLDYFSKEYNFIKNTLYLGQREGLKLKLYKNKELEVDEWTYGKDTIQLEPLHPLLE